MCRSIHPDPEIRENRCSTGISGEPGDPYHHWWSPRGSVVQVAQHDHLALLTLLVAHGVSVLTRIGQQSDTVTECSRVADLPDRQHIWGQPPGVGLARITRNSRNSVACNLRVLVHHLVRLPPFVAERAPICI